MAKYKHSADSIKESANKRFVTDDQINRWDDAASAIELNTEEVTGSDIITIEDTISAPITDIELLGNTVQDPDNLEDIKSTGILQEDGLYKYTIRVNNGDLLENSVDIFLPCQLEKVEDVSDRLYYDSDKQAWCIEKNVKSIILSGDDIEKYYSNNDNMKTVWFKKPDKMSFIYDVKQINSLGLPYKYQGHDDTEHFYISKSNVIIYITIENYEDLNSAKQYFNENNIILVANLIEPEIIVLPLDVQIHLNSFAGLTNIILECGEVNGTLNCKVVKSLGSKIEAIGDKINEYDDRIDNIENLNESQSYEYRTNKKSITATKSADSIVQDLSIKGNTMINRLPDDIDMTLIGKVDERDDYVTTDQGLNGGKVEVIVEGHSALNLSKIKEDTAVTHKRDDEEGNEIILINEEPGSIDLTIEGNTLVNRINNVEEQIDLLELDSANIPVKYEFVGNYNELNNEESSAVSIGSIVGNTYANRIVNGDKELVLNSFDTDLQGKSIEETRFTEGAKVDVEIQGHTANNLIDLKGPIPVIYKFPDINGNSGKLEGAIEGTCEVNSIYGNTLVNLAQNPSVPHVQGGSFTYTQDTITITGFNEGFTTYNVLFTFNIPLKPSTLYTLIITEYYDKDIIIREWKNGINIYTGVLVNRCATFTTTSVQDSAITIYLKCKQELRSFSRKQIIILEGDHTANPPTEYFEGIQSSYEDCKTKNLLKLDNSLNNVLHGITFTVDEANQMICYKGVSSNTYALTGFMDITNKLTIGKTYTFSSISTDNRVHGIIKQTSSVNGASHHLTFTMTEDITEVIVYAQIPESGITVDGNIKFQLEEGEITTEYEPNDKYKVEVKMYKPYNATDLITKLKGGN